MGGSKGEAHQGQIKNPALGRSFLDPEYPAIEVQAFPRAALVQVSGWHGRDRTSGRAVNSRLLYR